MRPPPPAQQPQPRRTPADPGQGRGSSASSSNPQKPSRGGGGNTGNAARRALCSPASWNREPERPPSPGHSPNSHRAAHAGAPSPLDADFRVGGGPGTAQPCLSFPRSPPNPPGLDWVGAAGRGRPQELPDLGRADKSPARSPRSPGQGGASKQNLWAPAQQHGGRRNGGAPASPQPPPEPGNAPEHPSGANSQGRGQFPKKARDTPSRGGRWQEMSPSCPHPAPASPGHRNLHRGAPLHRPRHPPNRRHPKLGIPQAEKPQTGDTANRRHPKPRGHPKPGTHRKPRTPQTGGTPRTGDGENPALFPAPATGSGGSRSPNSRGGSGSEASPPQPGSRRDTPGHAAQVWGWPVPVTAPPKPPPGPFWGGHEPISAGASRDPRSEAPGSSSEATGAGRTRPWVGVPRVPEGRGGSRAPPWLRSLLPRSNNNSSSHGGAEMHPWNAERHMPASSSCCQGHPPGKNRHPWGSPKDPPGGGKVIQQKLAPSRGKKTQRSPCGGALCREKREFPIGDRDWGGPVERGGAQRVTAVGWHGRCPG